MNPASRAVGRIGKGSLRRHRRLSYGFFPLRSFGPGGASGIIPGIVEDMLLASPNDVGQVEEWLRTRRDIAAVILEPTGATFGQIRSSLQPTGTAAGAATYIPRSLQLGVRFEF